MERQTRRIADSIVLLAATLLLSGAEMAAQLAPPQNNFTEQREITTPVWNPDPAEAPTATAGARLLRFKGRALNAAGEPLEGVAGVTFAIYAEQSGGAALWQETQTVATDATGSYSVLLGASNSAGVPAELFADGAPRWLAVLAHTPGAVEQPRVLLVSVPYAMQAVNADQLGGLPASAYVRANSAIAQPSPGVAANSNFACKVLPFGSVAAIAASAGYLPVFNDGVGNLRNSSLYQAASGSVGIGTSVPDQTLTVAGAVHSTTGGFVFPDGSKMLTAASGTNPLNGNLTLAAGSNAGSAGNADLQTVGDITNTMSDRLLIVGAPKAMTGAVPKANLFSVHIATGDAAGGKVKFTVVASDGTNYAMETGEIIYLSSPKIMSCVVVVSQYSSVPPTYTNTALAVPPLGQTGALNAQCLATTFGSDPGLVIFDTAPTSFTPTTHKVYYTIENQSQAAVTLQP